MWIKRLVAENFSGMNFNDAYERNSVRISGRNKSGKSTRVKAFFWLLSGYTDAHSVANSNLFDNRVPLTKDTPEARVKAVVVLDNGEEYTIERVAIASFTRKRGTDEYVKSASDVYKYFVDNIERNATDFREWVSLNIASEELLRFCLDGSFFTALCFDDKKKARQIIEKVVGTVTREEMKGDYADIDELLKKYTLDEIEQRATNLAKGINQRLNEIPSLIQNAEHQIAEIEQNDFAANDAEIARLEQQRDNCDKQMLDLSERLRPQMEARAEAIRAAEAKQEILNEAYLKWRNEPQDEIYRLRKEARAIQQQNEDSRRKYDEAVSKKDRYIKMRDSAIIDLKAAELQREKLLNDRDTEKAKTINPNETVCPHCGAQLQGNKLQEVIDRFERVKRDRIDNIVAQGRRTNDEIARLTKIAEDAQPYIDAPLPQVITQSTESLEKRIAELSGVSRLMSDFLETEQGKALKADVNSVVIPEVRLAGNDEIKANKYAIDVALIPLYEKRGLKSRSESLKNTIVELRTEQREKGADLASYERQRQLVKAYKQEQMEILSQKVNQNLKFSKIEVWSQQKDGTVVADLVIKDANGVNFASTNQASRIVTTCDIQRFFCQKLGVNLPTFVDESATIDAENLPTFPDTQMFYLFRDDTPLTINTL